MKTKVTSQATSCKRLRWLGRAHWRAKLGPGHFLNYCRNAAASSRHSSSTAGTAAAQQAQQQQCTTPVMLSNADKWVMPSKQADEQQPRSQAAGPQAHLIAFIISKSNALHWLMENGGHRAHGRGNQRPLQWSQQHLTPIHNGCCSIGAYIVVHAKIYLHSTDSLSIIDPGNSLQAGSGCRCSRQDHLQCSLLS